MVLSIHSYQCKCGWYGEWFTGGFRRKLTLVEGVEKELLEAENQVGRSVWRSIYQQILKGKILNEEASYQRGLVICKECKSSHEQLAVYETDSRSCIHPIVCRYCGNEAEIFHRPEIITCPSCNQRVNEGKRLSSQELYRRKLNQCDFTFSEGSSGKVVFAVGKRAISYIEPNLSVIPHSLVTVERIDSIGNGFDLDLFGEAQFNSKAMLITSPESSKFDSELAVLLLNQLQLMNIEVTPIVTTPPEFEGRKRIKEAISHIQELQKHAKKMIVLSGPAQEKQHGPSIDLYKQHIPAQIKEILTQW
jgi:uncharacterized CHY-type Zn-finger protein